MAADAIIRRRGMRNATFPKTVLTPINSFTISLLSEVVQSIGLVHDRKKSPLPTGGSQKVPQRGNG